MTLFDPVEELCLFGSKETLARCLSCQLCSRVRMKEIDSLERGCFYTGIGIMGSSLLPLSLAVPEVGQMQFILKVPEKSVPHLDLLIHGCGSQQLNWINICLLLDDLLKHATYATYSMMVPKMRGPS
ncbi:hypothetical protein AMECASPLE_008936 [Ameca splendens]|uniref:Uncharacterized protein n=1 Tax=Ameca splendens TaxID=208324 RepID=A0ABV0XP36_9TELE